MQKEQFMLGRQSPNWGHKMPPSAVGFAGENFWADKTMEEFQIQGLEHLIWLFWQTR